MVFKSLILQGFKSFPDKTRIDFAEGMTAIVGPNGAGKSNLSDAIRWVLGEQSSRSLRGAKMEDVIFGGTAKRGPTGFAEVSLVLDNAAGRFRSNYTELMVTRRYYRSGESEYYLNKKHCRLKDIHELFMDTGLGRDGYSSIGQGRIDEILSLKSEDRREIFEEAAGITKFRYRKEEAERKLSATEDNLTRIGDIYEELSRQIGPLEKQAEKAKQYLLLRDELRVLELSLWLRELAQLEEEQHKVGEHTDICQTHLAQAQEEHGTLYRRVEQLSETMRTLDREAEAVRTKLRQAQQTQAALAQNAAVLRTNLDNTRNTLARAARLREDEQRRADELTDRLAAHRARVAALTEEQSVRQRACAQWTQQCQQQAEAQRQAEIRMHECEQQCDECLAQLHAAQLARTEAQAGLNGIGEQQQTREQTRIQAQSALDQAQHEQAALERQLAACAAQMTQYEAVQQDKQTACANAHTALTEAQQALAEITSALTEAQSRVRMLDELQREYEGFSRAVKAVMGQVKRGELLGVHGPVSSLLRTEGELVTAIDTALGGSASSIVVDTAQTGKQCIAYLRKTNGGRATFLPLDTIQGSVLREHDLTAYDGCLGTADKLVQYAPQYQAIVQSLLARTVICRDMDAALSLAKARGYRFRIVTLDGQVIAAGGAMTGGSVSKGTGALARAERLREQEAQVQALCTQRDRAAQQADALAQRHAQLQRDFAQAQVQCVELRERQAGLRASVEQHRTLVDSLAARCAGLEQAQTALLDTKAKHEQVLRECDTQETQAQHAYTQAQAAQRQARAQWHTLTEQIGQTRAQQSEAERALTQATTALEGETRGLDEVQRTKQALDERIQAQTDEYEQAARRINEQTDALLQCEHEIAQAEHEQQAFEQRLDEVRAAHEQAEGERSAAERHAQERGEEVLVLEREALRLETRTAQLADERKRILDAMWEQYALTPTPAASLVQPMDDCVQAKERVKMLHSRMRALQPVNIDSIDAFTQMHERYRFLGEQRDDLQTARGELHKVIGQLTARMKEVFASEFAKLNGYFGETFREIFGGGHAELQLSDTSDILHCGIDIRVSLPGKAVKTLTLLSGGEKAFVAIALYFAILKLRPTPFCVLDEIEAALDDVNVQRFAQYIHRLTDKTQFIVITHRRGTMEQADMLYGVTMQEQGISRLLMLNLAQAEQQLASSIR